MSRHLGLIVAAGVLLAAAGCGKKQRPTLTETARSEHFIYEFAKGDGVNVEWQEKYFDWASSTIGVTIDEPIRYCKYRSREHMKDVIGVGNSNAFANARSFTLHTLWRADNHETIHLLASRFATPGPVALLAEGFAVAHQVDPVKADFAPKWNGRYLPQHLETFRAQGRFVRPTQMLTTKAFRAVADVVTYPTSGAFVRYLIDRFGYDKIKALFKRGTPNDTDAAVREAFADVFGATIDDVEKDWLAAIAK